MKFFKKLAHKFALRRILSAPPDRGEPAHIEAAEETTSPPSHRSFLIPDTSTVGFRIYPSIGWASLPEVSLEDWLRLVPEFTDADHSYYRKLDTCLTKQNRDLDILVLIGSYGATETILMSPPTVQQYETRTAEMRPRYEMITRLYGFLWIYRTIRHLEKSLPAIITESVQTIIHNYAVTNAHWLICMIGHRLRQHDPALRPRIIFFDVDGCGSGDNINSFYVLTRRVALEHTREGVT